MFDVIKLIFIRIVCIINHIKFILNENIHNYWTSKKTDWIKLFR